MAHLLSLTPLRRIVKDYYMVCDSYYEAIRTATPDRIEALDMARRSLHDEGSQLLSERLKQKVDDRFRNRTAAVHADLRAALEGLTVEEERVAAAGGAVRLRVQFGALADGGGVAAADGARGARRRLGRRAQGRRSIRSRSRRWRRPASTSPRTSP